MNYHELFATLVALTAFAGIVNDRYLKLPKTIALTIISILIAIIVTTVSKSLPEHVGPVYHMVKSVDFKYTVLNVMLGYLLFASGLHMNSIELKKEMKPVIYLASVGVVISTFLTGYMLYYLSGLFKLPFTLGECLIFGAVISPTDAIAVLGTFKSIKKYPQRLKTLITGEGLFNDAGAILMLIILTEVVYYDVHLTFLGIVEKLVIEAGGGILWGVIIAYIASFLMKQAKSPEVATLITIATSSVGYISADRFHFSGAITMVVAGLIIGGLAKKEHFCPDITLVVNNFWELIDEILNGFLFILIGLAIININIDKNAIIAGLVCVIIVFIARLLSICFPDLIISNLLRKKGMNFSLNKSILMAWGGIRGGLSIALALSIEQFPDSLVAITYVVVICSILIQGGTFKWAIKKLAR